MGDVFEVGLNPLPDYSSYNAGRLVYSNETFRDSSDFGNRPVEMLSLFIVIMTSLSIVSVVLAFITYSLYSNLRSISGTALLNLLSGLFLAHVLSVVGVEGIEDQEICFTIALILQYLWTAVHFWLTTMALDTYRTFRDNVNLLSPPASEAKPFLGCAVFAWGAPVPIAALAAVLHGKVGDGSLRPLLAPTCWIIDGHVLLYTFILPAAFLAIVDVSLFVRSAIVTRYAASLQMNRRTGEKMRQRRTVHLCLYGKLLLLLLSNWACCLLALFTRDAVLWFIFSLLTSLQGFFVALAYACNSHVFRLYKKSLKKRRNAKKFPGYSSFELSHSASMSLLNWHPSPDAV